MNTSRPTHSMSQYDKDMSVYTYILNTVSSIRLQSIGQTDNDHGAEILSAIRTQIQIFKPIKPHTNHDAIKESAASAMQSALI